MVSRLQSSRFVEMSISYVACDAYKCEYISDSGYTTVKNYNYHKLCCKYKQTHIHGEKCVNLPVSSVQKSALEQQFSNLGVFVNTPDGSNFRRAV